MRLSSRSHLLGNLVLCPRVLHKNRDGYSLLHSHFRFPAAQFFTPGLERIGPHRSPIDAKAAALVGHGMIRMRVDAKERLHPSVNVALDDVCPRLLEASGAPRALP